MATLQKTFKYNGTLPAAAIPVVNFNFKIPGFEFIVTTTNDKPAINRSSAGSQEVSILSALTDTTYKVNFPNEYLIGSTDISVLNFWSYIGGIGYINNDPELLATLTTQIDVQVNDETGNVFSQIFLNSIYGVAMSSDKYTEVLQLQAAMRSALTLNINAEKEFQLALINYLRNNIFILNKDVFDSLAAKSKTIAPDVNKYALLYLIGLSTDLSTSQPVYTPNTNAVNSFLASIKISTPEPLTNLINLIKNNYDNLFDFPIVIPEIKSTEIKGALKIKTSDGSTVTINDFTLYDIDVEYSITTSDNYIQPMSLTFDWNSADTSQLADNTIPFSFLPVLTNLVNSFFDIRIKAFDGSVLWQKNYAPANPELQQLKIEVTSLKPAKPSLDTPAPSGSNKKLSGKVVEMSGLCNIKDVIVVIQAKQTNDTIWKIIGTSTTDASGNFSMPYPFGNYVAAQALLSLASDNPADIAINSDSNHVSINETIADDFLYLLVKDADCTSADESDDCNCNDPKKSNRLPNQTDLINSDSYTQDIGGSCINLSIPNRTLSEYTYKAIVRTSDPDVANYILSKDDNGTFRLQGGQTKINRKPVDLGNPIYWQDAPDNHNNLSLYQAVTVATGHVLHYSVVTKADGYSMGELLYSLPLAPGQKKEIVVIDQTHTLQGSETQNISQRDSLAASLVNDVDITDTIAGNINQSDSGKSSANTGGVSAGLGLAGIIDGIGGVLGISGGFANANSSASQNSSRNLAEYFHEHLKDSVTQNAQDYRSLNASVITTVQEGQNYGVTSEVVANHNHCHSLTMMYFEVLRHYAIYQDLDFVEECLFVPLLMTDFTLENIYKWRDVLAVNLLAMPSETYLQPFTVIKSGRQHPLLRAFDAIGRIKTNYANVDFPVDSYDDEPISFITGQMYIHTNLPRPKTTYDRIKSWPIVKHENTHSFWASVGGVLAGPIGALVAGSMFDSDGNLTPDVKNVIDNYITIDGDFESVPPAQCIRVIQIDKFFFTGGGFDQAQWTAYSTLLGQDVFLMLGYYFKNRLISEWDSIFYNDIAPLVFEKICGSISLQNHSVAAPGINTNFSGIDFAIETKYKGGDINAKINLRGNGSNIKRNQITELQIAFNNFANLTNDLVTLFVRNVSIQYSTPHYNGILYNGYVGDDLIDNTVLYTPENANEKRNPRVEDQYLAARLVEHLNSNLEYYNKVLWRNLDEDRRYMLLDGFCIETYDDYGQPYLTRSLASVVKNELIGIAGNALIMPVAPGYKVDRTYIVQKSDDDVPNEIDLLDHYKPLTPIPPYRVSVPSKGVFAEAVQGACDACEKVKDNTSQDWTKFTTDEPTAINPVTTPVPTITDWKAAFKDLATPMINIQNAPATPTPGAGLAGISDLLGKSDIFKDVTGLDQNQKNALATYMSNQDNAKAFASMAKDMATQAHNTQNSDQIQDSINNAKNSGALTPDQANQLTKDHIQQMIDGGQTTKAQQDADAQSNKPSLTQAATQAAADGKPVKASNTDAAGNSESVDIGAGTPNKYRVGTVPYVSQGTKINGCWAAAVTMLMSWQDGKNYSILDVLATADEGNADTGFEDMYKNDQPLTATMKGGLLVLLNMDAESQSTNKFDSYIGWLKKFGPIWITVDSDDSSGISPHAKVLIGYNGDGTEQNSQLVFYDPAKSGEQTESFADFLKEFKALVNDNTTVNNFIQVVHFDDEIVGEGKSKSSFKAQPIQGTIPVINYKYTLTGSIIVFDEVVAQLIRNIYDKADEDWATAYAKAVYNTAFLGEIYYSLELDGIQRDLTSILKSNSGINPVQTIMLLSKDNIQNSILKNNPNVKIISNISAPDPSINESEEAFIQNINFEILGVFGEGSSEVKGSATLKIEGLGEFGFESSTSQDIPGSDFSILINLELKTYYKTKTWSLTRKSIVFPGTIPIKAELFNITVFDVLTVDNPDSIKPQLSVGDHLPVNSDDSYIGDLLLGDQIPIEGV